MKMFFVMVSLVVISTPRNIQFTKTLTCIKEDVLSCIHWSQSTVLSYSVNMPNGFSEDTYVFTPQGPKPMSDIKIDDEILAYDGERGQIYSKVIAWLHRNTKSSYKYHKIQTEDGLSYHASKHQNVAIFDSLGNIHYKFSKDLMMGDDLVESYPHVESVAEEEIKTGIYSPFTQIGNYYILDTSASEQIKTDKSNISMILIHVLSQVKNPNSQLLRAKRIIQFLQYFGWSQQPEGSQVYSHPIADYFSLIFGENFIESTQQVTYQLKRNASSSTYQLLEPNCTASSSGQQEQQQKNRIFGAGLSFDMIIGLTLL